MFETRLALLGKTSFFRGKLSKGFTFFLVQSLFITKKTQIQTKKSFPGNYSQKYGLYIFLAMVQVSICQNHLFLHQLTHNMTTDCSLNYEIRTLKFQAQNMLRKCCIHKLFFVFAFTFRTIYVLSMYTTCSQHVLNMF